MNKLFDFLSKGLLVSAQLPLDAKTYFPTIIQMQDLGTANSRAFYYYDMMKVSCSETQSFYIWQEVDVNYTGGVLNSNFRYPDNVLSNGVDYSNKYYNFVKETEPTSEPIAKPFIIFKNYPNNTENYLQTGDIVMGFFAPTQFVTLRYLGGAVNQESSWALINKINPTNFNTPGITNI